MMRFRRWLYRSAVARPPARKSKLDMLRLEDRVVPALASPPAELFATLSAPKSVLLPDLNADGRADIAALLPNGTVTTALNTGAGTWGPVATSDLGTTAVTGFAFAHFDIDPFPDLVAQTPDGIVVARGDGAGRFVHAVAIPLGTAGDFAAGTSRIDPAGGFTAPVRLPSGGTTPVAAVTAQLVGDAAPDVAVGHQDGTVTVFRGNADGTFTAAPGATATGLGVVTGLAAADVNGDGELDLVVAGTDRVTVLTNRPDPAPQTVLSNGDFAQGLTGWTVESGTVSASGFAQFREHSTSLLSSLRQSFVVPTGPATLTFDVTGLALESPAGVPPEAFEVSILDDGCNPLVATFRADGSSFLNLNPGGRVNLAPGVQFDGRHAIVDISGLAPGTRATVYFDLVGNKPGSTSTASIDNVAVNPVAQFADGFDPVALAGPFASAAGVAAGDVDGDGKTDVVVADGGSVILFAGDGAGGFTRSTYSLAPNGGAASIAIAPLTAGDAVADVAVGVASGVRTPLTATGGVLDAAPRILPLTALTGTEGTSITLNGSFSDPDAGGPYTATVDWGDGTTTAGVVTFASGVGTVTATHTYADNGTYPVRVIVRAASGAADFRDATATIANVAPTVTASDLVVDARYGPEVVVATFSDPGFTLPDYRTRETFLATIDWGDGSPTPFGRVVVSNGGSGTPTTATVYGRPNYATPGVYTASVTVTDDDGGTHTASFTVVARATVGNSGVWWVPGNPGDTVRVRFDLIGEATGLNNELGYFVAQDATGTVAGVAPGDSAYLGKVLYFTQRGILFPQGSDPGAATWVDLPAGTFVGFYLVRDASTADLLDAPAPLISNPDVTVWLSPAAANPDAGTNHFARTDLAGGWVQYGAEDGPFGGDGDFDDLVFTAGPAASDPPVVGTFSLPPTAEGSTVSLAVPVYSQDSTGTLTASVNWGDGAVTSGVVTIVEGVRTITASHTYADNGPYSVTITATDAGGRVGTRSATATITNVAPIVTLAVDRTVRPGEVVSLTAATFTDSGFTSTLAGTSENFTATIDWGDGSAVGAGTLSVVNGAAGTPTTGSVSGSHTYTTPGNYTVTVTVHDDDGGTQTRTFVIHVAATAPSVTSAPDVSGIEGQSLTVTAGFTDPDPVDTFTASVVWGDGITTSAGVTFANGVGVVSASHVYPDNTAWPVSLTITDRYGLSVTRALTAGVANAAPIATPAAAQTTTAGSVLSVTAATFTDAGFTSVLAGTQETFTATIDWGDGSSIGAGTLSVVNGAAGKVTTGTVSGSHTYATAGTYTVTVTVQDDDSGTSIVTFPVTVNSAAPDLGCYPSTAPVITGVSRASAITSGAATTSDTSVVVYGTGQPGATLTISRQGVGTVGTVIVGGDGTWRFDYTGTVLSAGSYSFTAEQAGFGPLGIAAPYNVFVLGNASGTPDTKGRYAAGGTVNLSNFSIGQDLPASNGSRDNLVAGGSLTLTGGQVYNDNATYSSTRTVSANTTLAQGAVRKESVVDFTAAGTWLRGRADAWAALTATGSTTYTPTDSRWAITLTTTASGLVVFNVDGAKLSAASSFTINAPAGTTVLVNVTGTSGTLQNFGFFLNNGVDRNHVLFNFANYTSLTVNSVGVTGTLFAPRAAVTFNNGNVDGQLVAASLAGSGVFRNYTFAGECPVQTSPAFTVTVAAPSSEAAPKFFVVGPGQGSRYTSGGTLLGTSVVPGPTGTPVGVTANAAGTSTWVVTAMSDGTTWVTVADADGSERGRWRAWGVTDARDIATSGTDIWIVGRDASTNALRVFRFEKGAMVRSGGLEPAGSFALHSSNTNPSGLATDGWNVFVTDDGSVGRVFAYDVNGNALGGSNGWQLDARNGDPSGVALNPGGGSELWVVDRTTKQVFTYSNGRNNHWWNSGGPQASSSLFNLAAGSPAPEGIADPDPTPIAFGDLVTGNLTGPGDAGVFTFTTTAGKTIFLDADPDNFDVEWRLTDPAGGTVVWNQQYDRVVTAPLDGAYLLTVTSPFGDPVSYGFRVQELVPVPITLGTTVTGSIPAAGAAFTFDAAANDRIRFDPVGPNGVAARWVLTGPSGRVVFDRDPAAGAVTRRLSAGATYVLTVIPVPGESGPFDFQTDWEPAAPTGLSLTLDTPVDGTFAGEDDEHLYTFAASGADGFFLDGPAAGVSPSVTWDLYAPSGAWLAGSGEGRATVPLTESGDYSLYVSPGDLPAGSYRFLPTREGATPPVPSALLADTPVSLVGPADRSDYTFAGTAGQQVRVIWNGQPWNGQQAVLSFRSPSGVDLVGEDYPAPYSLDHLMTLPETGVYTVTAAGNPNWSPGDDPEIGPLTWVDAFSLRFETVAVVITPVAIGDTVTGTLPVAGGSAAYSFVAAAGQRLYLDAAFESSEFRWALVGPDGGIFDRSFGDPGGITFATAGEYILTLTRPVSQGNTVGYTFTILDVPLPTSIPIVPDVTVVEGSLAVPGQQNTYTFEAQAGDRFFLDRLRDPTFDTRAHRFSVRGPGGEVVAGPTPGDIPVIVAAAAGTYTVVVEPPTPDYQPGLTDYRFLLKAVPPAVGYGVPVEVTNGESEQAAVGFTGTAGDRVMFDSQLAPTFSSYSVYRPDGSLAWSQGADVDRDAFVLDQTGVYTVVAQSGYEGTLRFAIVAVADPVTLPGALDTDLVGVVETYGQRVSYTFAGTAGEPVVFDVFGNSSGLGFTVTDPNGTLVWGPSQANSQPFVLPADGIYTLTAVGFSNEQGVAGAFRARVQTVPTPVAGPPDTVGTEFWLTVPNQHVFYSAFLGNTNGVAEPILYVSSDTATSGVVSLPSLGWYGSFSVAAGGTAAVAIPSFAEGWIGEHIAAAVHLVSYDPVSVVGLTYSPYAAEGYLALPVDAAGRDYVVLTGGQSGGVGYSPAFQIVATEDNTTITITPSIDIFGHPVGVPYSFVLNRGQVYSLGAAQFAPGADPTGTLVSADKPVAVYGSHPFTTFGSATANHIVEMLPPVSTWGREYPIVPAPGRPGGSYIRVVAAADGTEVRVDGVLVATLNRGGFHDFLATAPTVVTASASVLVGQFTFSQGYDEALGGVGDPSFLITPAAEQYQTDYVITSPDKPTFVTHYVSLVVPSTGVGLVTIDGVAFPAGNFTRIGTSDFFAASVPVSAGRHRLSGPVPFGATAYGAGPFDAYSFGAGTSLAPIAAVAGVSLLPETATAAIGVEVPFEARVVDSAGNPVAGVRVDFAVTGPNGAAGFDVTDAQGKATFRYAGTVAGTDTVTATVVGFTDSSTVLWSAAVAPPTVAFDSPPAGTTFPAGSVVVVTGVAAAGTPSGRVTLVTVNGVPADAVDATGRFFARVTLAAGANTFTAVARDTSGQTATAALSLTGGPAALDIASSDDITPLGAIVYTDTTFDRRSRTIRADAAFTNISTSPITGPVAAAFAGFDPADVTLHGTAVTPDGDPYLTFAGPVAAGAATSTVRASFDDPRGERFSFTVRFLAPDNVAPRFTSAPEVDATEGRLFDATLVATDADGDAVTFRLASGPAGMTVDSVTGAVTWTPSTDQVGTHRVEFSADDGRGGVATQVVQITVRGSGANRAPAFASVPPTVVAAGSEYVYVPTAADADGDTLTFELVQGPAGTFDPATGEIRFSAAPGVYPVVLAVTDGQGGRAEQRFAVSVGGAASAALAITSTPVDSVKAGDQYAYLPVVAGGVGFPRVYALTTAPDGMAIDSTTGLITWTPRADQAGPHTVVLEVSAGGASAVQTFAVTALAAANRAPVFTTRPPLLATRGLPFSYSSLATDADGDAVAYSVVAGPGWLDIDPDTGVVAADTTGVVSGSYLVTLKAVDRTGAAGWQSFFLEVRASNTAPVISGPSTAAVTAGQTVFAQFTAFDAELDAVRFSVAGGPTEARIDPTTGRLVWPTASDDQGPITVIVRATDERGAFTDFSFVVTVAADTTAPSVVIGLDRNGVNPGDPVVVTVYASDDVGAGGLTLTVDGVPVTLDGFGKATITPANPGVIRLTATATDAAGNLGSGSASLRVLDPSDTDRPVVTITSPETGAVVSYLTEIHGTITDANLDGYRVEVSRYGSDIWRTIAAGTEVPADGVLAVFDPTLLDNDTYTIRVVATDVNLRETVVDLDVGLTGGAKVGNFRQEFTDLSIPLAGIPITITRVYDTLKADQSGDFGFGWTLGAGYDPRVRETRPVNPAETLLGAFVAFPFKEGTRVYVNTPDGRRVGFTFAPKPYDGVLTELGGPGDGYYEPYFRPDPGVFETLAGVGDTLGSIDLPLIKVGDSYYLAGLNVAYNPSAYRLTTKDGHTYQFSQFTGLQTITDRNGVTLTFTRDGVFSSLGESITFTRDSAGRITAVTDPAGNDITYTYDANGDLIGIVDQVGTKSQFTYSADLPHFLVDINNATGACGCFTSAPPMRMEYDDNGRLILQANELGEATSYAYDLAANTEVIRDALGNPTTVVYDDRGHILRSTDALGHSVEYTIDGADNLLTVTDANGYTTTSTFDARGNRTSVTDELGHTTTTGFNELKKVVHSTDAEGREFRYEFDPRGNLVRVLAPPTVAVPAAAPLAFSLFSFGSFAPLSADDGFGDEPYDGSGDPTVTEFTYDSEGRNLAVADAQGAVTAFGYGVYGAPTLVITADGDSGVGVYDSLGRPLEVSDENGWVGVFSVGILGGQ